MTRLLLVAACLCSAVCARPVDTWTGLRDRLGRLSPDDRSAEIERYVVAHGGTPLIEEDSRLVFLARHPAGEPPRVVGDFNRWATTDDGYDSSVGAMVPIEGTDWWYLEAAADADARIEYVLLDAAGVALDPLNPRSIQSSGGDHSEVRMPAWTPQPELDNGSDVAAGHLLPESFTSTALGGARRVWYYLPDGYDTSLERRYPTVFVLDGGSYVEHMDVPRVLDRLIARGVIGPLIAVFVEPADRQNEYTGNTRWRAFMASELAPAVDRRFRTEAGAGRHIVLGSSLGADGAVDLAVAFPDVFGACAALAPTARSTASVSAGPTAHAAARRIRFFIVGGRYDALLVHARDLDATLGSVGATRQLVEVPEGHGRETFRGHLDDALKALIG